MIEVKNLTKKYGSFEAVSDLSFTIEPGHIYGFLGPNGAGKSTTMNIMTGCLSQTAGTVTVNGHDVYEEPKEAKKCIGYLPEIPPLYPEETPLEYLDFVAEAKGIKASDREDAIDAVIRETHIEEVQDRLIKNLSKGFRQRVGMAQALLGNPEVIILDEPTVGLDPAQIIEIRDLIKELGEKHTVILSSHILSEIQAICDHVIIINHGHLIADDTLENIGKMTGEGYVELVADGDAEKITELLTALDGVSDVKVLSTENTAVTLKVTLSGDPETKAKEIALALAQHMIPVYKLNPVKASLENIFIELTDSNEVPAAEEAAETTEASAETEAAAEEAAETTEAAAETEAAANPAEQEGEQA